MKISVSATEFFSPQQVAQILSDLILLRHVAATKFCCKNKDFLKSSPVHTERFVAATCRRVAATWSCNLSPSVYRPLDM